MPEHPQQRAGGAVGVDAGVLEQLVDCDVEDAGGVVGALDVATDPVQRFGVAGKHHRLLLDSTAAVCCCCCCSGRGPTTATAVVAAERVAVLSAFDLCGALGSLRTTSAAASSRSADRRARRQHPGVLRAAALAGVDHQRALRQRDAGQAAGQHPHVVTVVDRERPQVDVARRELVIDLGRHRRQLHDRLGDPAARVVADLLADRGEFLLPTRRGRRRCRSRRTLRRV